MLCVSSSSYVDVHDHPLYVHAHSKAILMQALSADTEFLVEHNVMDYSLLVGVCSESQQIVVGVIGKGTCVYGGCWETCRGY